MALEGTLSYLDVAHLLQVVGASLKSGVLDISWEDQWARLYFERGDLVRAESSRFHEWIGTLLRKARLVLEEDLERALALQMEERGKRRLGAILCDVFGVRPQDIERLLRKQFEQIVFDVFSWPGGRFVFSFHEPAAVAERFRLDAVDFILRVGIQAGLLAEEGVEREKADPDRPPLIFLEDDEVLAARYRQYWRRRGYRVTCFTRVEEVLATIGAWEDLRAPVVVASLVCPRSRDEGVLGGLEVIEAATSLAPPFPAVMLASTSDPKLRSAALTAGARAFVRKPKPEELQGIQAELQFDVFMLALARALEMALAGAGGLIALEGSP